MSFAQRSYQKELLDLDRIPVKDLHRNLYELNRINTWLGGHAVLLHGLSRLRLDRNSNCNILDIGCGGGDSLRAMAVFGRKKGLRFRLTGVDLKQDCIDYATGFCEDFKEIGFIRDDYRNVIETNQTYDLITASLFCHHLTEEEISGLFSWAQKNARLAFIMNDLHRHSFAYYSIAWLTWLFSRSYLVKNDAKLSVKRGFSKKELIDMLSRAGIRSYTLKWRWAFRWLLIINGNERS